MTVKRPDGRSLSFNNTVLSDGDIEYLNSVGAKAAAPTASGGGGGSGAVVAAGAGGNGDTPADM